MTNMLDYIRWRGDLLFSQSTVNCVDALIFSTIAYVRFEGRLMSDPEEPLSLRDAVEEFFTLENPGKHIRVKQDLELLRLAAESERFGNTRIVCYRQEFVPEKDTQFAAMTFLLDDGSMMLAFRGTDYTLVGWKEDFDMTFRQTVPAQRLALAYTRELYLKFLRPMYLCGHSKGGNLAVFAAARSSPMIQADIRTVYNHDGPGFTEYMMGDPGYLAMVPRIHTYIPQSSIVGMMLEHEEPHIIIHSNQNGIQQHDTYSWEVMGKKLVRDKELTQDARLISRTLKSWLTGMNTEQREKFVDAVFGLLMTGGADSSMEILHPKNVRAYLKLLGADEGTRHVIGSELQKLIDIVGKSIRTDDEVKVLTE